MLLVFVRTPNLERRRGNDYKRHQLKNMDGILCKKTRGKMNNKFEVLKEIGKSQNLNNHSILLITDQDVLGLTSELFNISRTLVQWAPSVANACRT